MADAPATGGHFRYFAYGSNMSTARLRERTPSAQALGTGRLPRHALRWHKLGRDGSGKCDALFTGDQADTVWGVLFDVAWAEKPRLDAAEGLGIGYFDIEVQVATATGTVHARTYQAWPDKIDTALRPFDWYKEHVLRGAHEHGLPVAYVAGIERIETVGPSPAE